MIQRDSGNHRPRVAIIGAGFGGLSAAKALRHALFDVIVMDHHNCHLFQPLLYQVATAALSPADIASPTRSILRDQKNATVVLARVSHIDLERKQVTAEEIRTAFDYLIVATGAQQSYFGHDLWAIYAPGLKSIDDATYVRRRILLAFEKAETEPNAVERRHLLNFVVVGGGATGVEKAGAIAELAKRALARDFRSIDPRSPRVVLVEAGPGCCPLSTPRYRKRHGIRSSISGSRCGSAPASPIATAKGCRWATNASRRAP
jgi:NADH:ubiquinone reductase (H+-translocating)